MIFGKEFYPKKYTYSVYEQNICQNRVDACPLQEYKTIILKDLKPIRLSFYFVNLIAIM